MTIPEIKERLRVTEVLAKYGLSVKKGNMIHCPFHDDKTPSMQVYLDTDSLYCFSGNCQHGAKKMDVIDFIMYMDKSTKAEAVAKAKEMVSPNNSITPNTNQKAAKKMKAKDPNQLELVFGELQKNLTNSKKAQDYLKARNIPLDAKDQIGYRNHKATIPNMKDCLIFPLKDEQDKIVSVYGRSIKETANNKGHYYQQGRNGLYPSYPPKDTQTVILTESVIDCLTLEKHTERTANTAYLALYGTNGLTPEHFKALQQLKDLEEIILFLDGDEAGRAAANKYAKMLYDTLEVNVSQVETPENEDVNSLLDTHEDTAILSHLVSQRVVLYSNNVEGQTSKVKSEKTPTPNIANRKSHTAQLCTENKEYLTYQAENVLIVVLGGIGLRPIDKMKVTLKLSRTDSRNPMHQVRHSLDLYYEDQLDKLGRKAAEKLEVGSKELIAILNQLTEALEQYRYEETERQKPKKIEKRSVTGDRLDKVLNFLKSKDLLSKTNDLIGKSGMIGEETNRLLMYLVFTSRLRAQPLHIVSLGASGTGKTYLQEKIAELIPEDQKLEITAMSENALYYFQKTELKNKLVLIEDLDGANDDKVLFAIRELQSKKRISKTVPVKDAKGNMQTMTLQVEGPISLAGTTTKEKLYEDNANRSLLIYLDNSKEHKEAIMDYQRKLSAGQIDKEKEEQVKEFFKDIQAVLEPIQVRNPYALQLKIPESVFKPLRTNAHYLGFIEVVTFYNQYNRERKQDPKTGKHYIETTLGDIAEANKLLKDVLLAKSDELTKSCRDFFERLKQWVTGQNKSSFYTKEVRTAFKISPTSLKRHLTNLQKYGYVTIVTGTRTKGYEYEVVAKQEYEDLKKSIGNALDQALGQLCIDLENKGNAV